MSDLEKSVSSALMKLGISPNNKGYYYLLKAIDICLKSNDISVNLSKYIYPEISEAFNRSSDSVERAIRFAIHRGYAHRDTEFASTVFGNTLQSEYDIPTNSLFVAALTEWAKQRL